MLRRILTLEALGLVVAVMMISAILMFTLAAGNLFADNEASTGQLLSAGLPGQVLMSQGPGQPAVWGNPPCGVQMDAGSYFGNEVDGRIIEVAFTPDAVFIIDKLNPPHNTPFTYQIFSDANMVLGAFEGRWDHNGNIVENGFTVGGPTDDDRRSANSDENGHEYHWIAFKTGTACAADLDGNAQVDSADLALLLGSWGPCPGKSN